MILGTVVGRVWSDRQLAGLDGRRLLIVRPLDGGPQIVAVDLVDVGASGTVLVTTDEAAAAASGESSVDAAIVALVSGYDVPPVGTAGGRGRAEIIVEAGQ